VTTLGSSGNESNGIAVQGTDVYWASVDWVSDAGPSGTGYLQTVSTWGGAVTILGTAQIPMAVAVDSTHVYWTSASDPDAGAQSSDDVLRMTPRGGGPTTVIATGLAGFAIALGTTGAYWVASGSSPTVMQTPLGGGAATSLASAQAGHQIVLLAVDASNLYFTDLFGGTNGGPESISIMKMSLAGGTPVALATLPTAGNYGSLAVGTSAVVWADYQGSVQSVPIAGGPVSTIFSDPGSPAALVAVDCDFVYFATGTEVMKAPLSGGTPTELAPTQPGWGTATGLAFDDSSLYFATTAPCATSSLGCAAVTKVTPK
jgi:hypothetical protein